MAAPSGIKWGSVAGNDGGRIGIYTSVSNTSASKSKVTIEVWFWSNYTVKDTSNTFYFNNNATSATSSKGSVSISHTNNTNGWSTSNQTKLGSYSYNYDRGTSAKTINCAAKLTGIDSNRLSGATMTATTSYTIPKAQSYTIKYNANGGSGTMADTTIIYGVSQATRTNTFTRTGYTFTGWHAYRHSDKLWYCKKSDGTTGWYASGSIPSGWSYYLWSNGGSASKTTSVDGDTITLYAQWSANTYTISYNANGGSGAPSATSYTYASSGTVTLSSTKPTRTGYTFLGWSTSSSATSASYSSGGAFNKNVASNTTLYAVWKINTYTVSYNANGGSGAPSSQTKTYGVTLTLSSTKPTRTGYTFLGWNSSSTATGAQYTAGGSYTNNASVTLYAVWQINTYTVSYNANGGSGAPSAQTKTYGVTLVLSSTKPTRSGYTFLGWGTSASATSASYSVGGNYTANSSATLYAVWTQSSTVQTIMASYQDVNGNYGSYSTVYTAALNSGATCSWTSPETDEYNSVSVSYTVGSTAVTKKVEISRKKYTISYDANGGVNAPKTQTFYYGGSLKLTTKRPTRSGYDFLGWSLDSISDEASYKTNDVYDSTDTSNPTLYAIWGKRIVNTRLYNTGKAVACEFIESDMSGFGKNGEIYATKFIEEDNGTAFSIFSETFKAIELSEVYYEKHYLTDGTDRLVDENGNYLFCYVEDLNYKIIEAELLSSDGYVLADSEGINLIAKRM